MELNYFLEKDNIKTLWDVISDEDIFKFLSKDIQGKISQIFLNNIKGFFELEKTKNHNLIDINKKFILLILNYIKTNYPEKIPNKIKIYEQPVKELITYEEIQNERKNDFEKDLLQRQEDFTNSMTLQVPQVPDFADKNIDKPISEMDKMIREMISKRNYDEQIKYNDNSNINNDWLKSQKTSVKSEKMNLNAETETNVHSNTNTNTFNLLENDEVFNKNFVTKKNVTWDDDNNIQYNIEYVNEYVNESVNENVNVNDVDNIFKKLKKIETPIYENNRIINLENEVKILNNKIDEIIYLLKQNK
jgi:hypothetical protein